MSEHKHRCMRCRQEFDCSSPDVCKANYDVLPTVVIRTPWGLKVIEHCPLLKKTYDDGDESHHSHLNGGDL